MHKLLKSSIDNVESLSKPKKKFLKKVVDAFCIFRGKANYSNLSRYCDYSEKTIRRWFNKGLDFLKINSSMLSNIPDNHDKICAIDATFINKSGKKTQGLGMFWSGSAGEAKKGLEASIVSIVDVDSNTAYGLDAEQTIDVADKTRTELYADHIEKTFEEIRKHGIKYIVADSFYSKNTFVNRITKSNFHMIGKLRKDANLKWEYTGKQTGIGRNKLYDGKVVFNDLGRFTYEYTVDDIEVYSAKVYSVTMKRFIKVVLLNDSAKDSYALLFSTDLLLSSENIVKYYKARFQIEFFIRDSKQHTGLMDCQSRNSKAINTHMNLAMAALNCLKMEDSFKKGSFKKSVISIASWKCIKFNKHYIKSILSKLEIGKDDNKYKELYDEFSNYGVIAA